jgi:hypothetical protein
VRLAATQAIHRSRDVVELCYQSLGTTAIFAGGPFERRLRDINTVTQHANTGRLDHYEEVGRFLFGLEPDTAMM